jgi:hypothetical protein
VEVEDVNVEDDFFAVSLKETRQVCGFRLSTGELLWGPSERQHYQDNWGYASSNSWDIIYDGKLISGNYGGIVYCYDIENGDLLWDYTIQDVYNSYLFNTNWRFRLAFIADGKLYIEHNEHSVVDPKPRGAPMTVLDLETGNKVFDINLRGTEWGSTFIIGDSTLVLYNTYDQQIYALGKGPSDITVSASPKAVAKGTSALIEGTVLDVSPGTEDAALQMRFNKGVPAVSDESMSSWMEYLYLQHERPDDVTGVTVKLEAVDPNGNYHMLGSTTTDSYGNYGFGFSPETTGTYMIIATFEGSNSYYPSSATAYLQVGEVSSGIPIEHETPLITTEIAIALVAVLAVVSVAAYVMLKRK